jgi:hypothetical protein
MTPAESSDPGKHLGSLFCLVARDTQLTPDPGKTLGSLFCLVARDTQLTHLIQVKPSAPSSAWWPGARPRLKHL